MKSKSGAEEIPNPPAATDRPNLLVLHADELFQQFLGIMGHPLVRTPHIDALARDGAVVFQNAYTCNGVCEPSRASLLTGRYPIAHGVIHNGIRLSPREQTMGKFFNQEGYVTGYFGKTHFGGNDEDMSAEGWQESFIWHKPYNAWLREKGIDATYPEGRKSIRSRTRYWGVGASRIPNEHYFENAMGDHAADFIRRHRDRPWLCFYGAIAPHGPFTPPEPYASMYDPADTELLPRFEGELDDKPPAFVRWVTQNQKYINEEEMRIYLAHIYGLITLVDDNVGKLVATLKEEGLYDQTLIVFTCDHGDFSTRFGAIGKSWNQLDCVMKTPLIMRRPGASGPIQRTDALASNVDLFPTFCELAGVEAPATLQGASLAGLLRGETDRVRDAVFAFDHAEYTADRLSMSMIRTETHKYIESTGFVGELYDMRADPWEVRNQVRAPEHAARVREMKDRLLQWHLHHTGGYLDPKTARYWEDETAFYDEKQFGGGRIHIRGTSPT